MNPLGTEPNEVEAQQQQFKRFLRILADLIKNGNVSEGTYTRNLAALPHVVRCAMTTQSRLQQKKNRWPLSTSPTGAAAATTEAAAEATTHVRGPGHLPPLQ